MRRATLLGGSGGKEKARGSFGFSLESHGNGKTESSGQWIPVRHRLIAFDLTGALLRENRHGDFTFATIPWTGKTDAKRFLFDERRKDMLVRRRTLPTGEVVASDTLRLPPVETNTYATESEGVTLLSSVPMSSYRIWTAAPDGNAWLAVTSSYEMHEVTLCGRHRSHREAATINIFS